MAHYLGKAVTSFFSPQFLQISLDAPEAMIEHVNKDSRIVRENHYSRYPRSKELLASYNQCRFAFFAIYRASGPILVMSSASNRAKSSFT